ncbi:MAG: PIN domain-containing protein [Lachnospiraceae bacterium]|nr:PIN domain-containing protein [Lachnospiraceae bacterium]
MRVLVDTNIILDYLLEREPYEKPAKRIIEACQKKQVFGCIAAHSVTNIFFILRKAFSIQERREVLLNLCKLFDVEGIDIYKLQNALRNEQFQDFEDCLQMECAKKFHADYIVTRNPGDFKYSSIKCIEPERFCELLNSNGMS